MSPEQLLCVEGKEASSAGQVTGENPGGVTATWAYRAPN